MINQRQIKKKPVKVEGHCQFCKMGLRHSTFHFLYIINNRIRFFLDKNEVYSSIQVCIKCYEKCRVIVTDFEFQKDVHKTIKKELIEKLAFAIKNFEEYNLSTEKSKRGESV
jgi:hypothetical protein